MRALVTGASGHIGANIVHELVDAGWEVAVFARPTSHLTAIEGLGCEVRHGDMLDAPSVRAAVDGCEVVFHAAAIYKNWTADPEQMPRTALDGTRNVFAAAKDSGVGRIVFTSSCNAIGFTRDPAHLPDETVWNDDPSTPYIRAKVESERLARQLAEELGLPCMTVLPTGVLGRFDYRTTPTTQNFLDIVHGRGPIGFPLNLVDVRDVAHAHRRAAEDGEPGGRYLAAGDNITPPELAAILAEELDIKAQESLPPLFLLRAVAWASEAWSAVTGREPMLTSGLVRELGRSKGIIFDDARSREALGLTPADARTVVRETARWAGHVGTLSGAVSDTVHERLPPDPDWMPPPP